MLILEAYSQIWLMSLFSFGFFVAVAFFAAFFRVPRLNFRLPPRFMFWWCLFLWFVVLSISLVLIDKPHLPLSKETLNWLFMFSAFLFIPISVPLLVGAVWALAHDMRGEVMRIASFGLATLAAFGLGCAASNIHDIVWCGIITHGYTEHHAAGYDLDVFVAFAKYFGITREVAADYATLGPYTMILVLGEVLVSCAAYLRLRRSL